MFDFLMQNKKGELQSYADLISIEIKKMKITNMAIEKAVGMIAHAIAKSEFIVQTPEGRQRDKLYWRLNVRPNNNEASTDFWIEVIQRLFRETECLIVVMDGMFYIADSWQTDNFVINTTKYSDVTIVTNGNEYPLQKTFGASTAINTAEGEKKNE